MKSTIRKKVEEAFQEKLKRARIQNPELQEYFLEAKNGKIKESKNIIKLWKKLAKELEPGANIIFLKTETKHRVFSRYRFLLINIAKKYTANPYFTLLELIQAGEKGLWGAIAGFGCKLVNDFLPQNKQFSENDFTKTPGVAHHLINQTICSIIRSERQKILGDEGMSVFIYRDKNGHVTDIHFSGMRGEIHSYEVFTGTDKERQDFAEKYERESKELAEAEKQLNY